MVWPFLYSGPIDVARDFYRRLCTPVFDEYDVNYKKETLFSMLNRLQIEGTGLPLHRGGEVAVALAFPRLPRADQWTTWFFKELEEMESVHGVATHIFATLLAENTGKMLPSVPSAFCSTPGSSPTLKLGLCRHRSPT